MYMDEKRNPASLSHLGSRIIFHSRKCKKSESYLKISAGTMLMATQGLKRHSKMKREGNDLRHVHIS